MNQRNRQVRSAFTLIELLTVIVIIAQLAAILFPVFGRVRENARRSSCQSNLKQIALGITQYTQDYDERFPTIYNGTLYGTSDGYSNWGLWMVYVYPYVKSTQIFRCPSSVKGENDKFQFTGTPSGDLTFPLMFNYGYNQNLVADLYPSGSKMGKSLAAVHQPSQLPLLGDSSGTVFNFARRIYNANNSQNGGAAWWDVPVEVDTNAARHLGGANVAFIDGHVKYMPQGKMGPDASRASQAAIEDRAYLPVRPEDDRLQ